MGTRISSPPMSRICLAIVLALFLGGCATLMEKKNESPLVETGPGTVIYKGKYEFQPPLGWALLQNVSEGDFEFGFLKVEKGDFPSQTTFIYDDGPFGSSRDLESRANEYFGRFLGGTGISLKLKDRKPVQVRQQPGVVMHIEGENRYRNEKARATVYLIKEGEWIVSFVCTQWRPMKGEFDPARFEVFENFVKSFKFLKPVFYEEIAQRIKKLEG